MAGSTARQLLAEYTVLAQYYDDLLGDEEALKLWLTYIKRYLQKGKVLELASGTGMMAKLLKNEGYEVIASDLAPAMRDAAKKNFGGPYLILDMQNFQLQERFDLILCIADSFNYLMDLKAVKAFFNNVYAHLKQGGYLIFDTHHPDRLAEFKEEYIEEGYLGDLPYQWTISADQDTETLAEHFAFYRPDRVLEEEHLQQLFQVDDIKALLAECHFKVDCYEDFIPTEKILFVGEK